MAKTNIKKNLDKIHVHDIWHAFCNYMKKWYFNKYRGTSLKTLKPTKREYKEFCSNKMIGYKAMCRLGKYAKDKDGIFITPCDDAVFAGSDIALIVHKDNKSFMGTTMILVPQCSTELNQVFLYPDHLNKLIKVLQKIQIMQQKKEK